jgi:GMP synthase (glutamine-hydrolysing)
MRIHCIIHAPFEMPGAVATWVLKKGYSLTFTHTYNGEKLPAVSAFDFLVIMGGPQSPLELNKFPYIANEIILTKQAIQANKPVIGFCLGAQIIGESLGATTQKSPHKEIGQYPIMLTKAAEQDPVFKTMSTTFDVIHWHNDMPGIPPNAVLLAYSEGCPQQAFRYGDRVYGLQFHMEMTQELVEGMIKHCPEDLQAGQYIRSEQELLNSDFAPMNQKLFSLLNYLASRMS